MIEAIAYLILFLGSFLAFMLLIKDSEFPKLFKQGKTTSIIICSILVSLILAFLLSSSLMKLVDVIKMIIMQ